MKYNMRFSLVIITAISLTSCSSAPAADSIEGNCKSIMTIVDDVSREIEYNWEWESEDPRPYSERWESIYPNLDSESRSYLEEAKSAFSEMQMAVAERMLLGDVGASNSEVRMKTDLYLEYADELTRRCVE